MTAKRNKPLRTKTVKLESEKNEMQAAFEKVEQNKREREERAMKRINDFIMLVQEEEGVEVGIPPIQIQPQLIVRAK